MYKIIKKGHYGFIRPEPDDKLKVILSNTLSYKNKWYPNMPEWAKRTRLYNKRFGMFRWGLIYRVEKVLKHYNIKYQVSEAPQILPQWQLNPILRPYQIKAIDQFKKYQLGIIQLPCGAGKTMIALEIFKQLARPKTCVIVHTNELKRQWEEQNGNKLLDVWTYQKLCRPENVGEIANYEFIIADECHLCKCKSIKNIFSKSKAKYILGLSASPTREDGHDMQIEECVGQVIYTESTADLIEQGYLSQAKIFMHNIEYHNDYFETYPELYADNIVLNDERNQTIQTICDDNKCLKTLVLVDRIEHGKLLYDMLKNKHKVIFFHSGMKQRKKQYELIKNQHYDIIISTQIFDTGIDFPWLHSLILASGGKSSVRIIQRTGRLLRTFAGKDKALIHDFDDKAKLLKKHTKIRMQYYIDNKFEVNKD